MTCNVNHGLNPDGTPFGHGTGALCRTGTVRELLSEQAVTDLETDLLRLQDQIGWVRQALDNPDGSRTRVLAHLAAIRSISERRLESVERAELKPRSKRAPVVHRDTVGWAPCGLSWSWHPTARKSRNPAEVTCKTCLKVQEIPHAIITLEN